MVSASPYADLAFAGIDPLIPYHKMFQTIETNFRKSNPADLCGSACGCNRTPTAAECMLFLKGETAGDLLPP